MTADITPRDRFAIRDTILEYAWSLDTRDVERFIAVFTPDGVFRTSSGGLYEGSAGLRTFIERVRSRGTRDTMHWMQQIYVEPDPAGCVARSYWTVVDPLALEIRAFAYSDDVCTRLDGRWRIKERRLSTWEAASLPWPKLA